MPTATRTRAPLSAYVLMSVVGVTGAAALAWLTVLFADGTFADDSDRTLALVLSVIVYAPVAFGTAWAVFIAKHTVPTEPHGDESIESRWLGRATSSAFTDLLTTLGLTLAVLGIGSLSVDATALLLVVVPAAMADVAVRYLILRRRES